MRRLSAGFPLLVWPLALAGLAIALAFSGGPVIWRPLASAAAQFGLVIGVIHFFVARAIRRRRPRPSRSRPAV